MKKHFLLITLLCLCSLYFINAQDCTFYFPVKVGTSMEMKHYNAKDKLTATTLTKVLEKTGNSIKFTSEFSDEKGKQHNTGQYEVHCKNGEFIVDMNSFTQNMNLDAYKNMEVKVEADEMSIPATLSAGMKLNDGEVRIKITNGSVTIMNMSVRIYNRKVEAQEDLTTPAGTFKCYKITYDIDSKVVFKTTSKGVEWLSQKAGVVKTESHDSKGKLIAYSILSELKE